MRNKSHNHHKKPNILVFIQTNYQSKEINNAQGHSYFKYLKPHTLHQEDCHMANCDEKQG